MPAQTTKFSAEELKAIKSQLTYLKRQIQTVYNLANRLDAINVELHNRRDSRMIHPSLVSIVSEMQRSFDYLAEVIVNDAADLEIMCQSYKQQLSAAQAKK